MRHVALDKKKRIEQRGRKNISNKEILRTKISLTKKIQGKFKGIR